MKMNENTANATENPEGMECYENVCETLKTLIKISKAFKSYTKPYEIHIYRALNDIKGNRMHAYALNVIISIGKALEASEDDVMASKDIENIKSTLKQIHTNEMYHKALENLERVSE